MRAHSHKTLVWEMFFYTFGTGPAWGSRTTGPRRGPRRPGSAWATWARCKCCHPRRGTSLGCCSLGVFSSGWSWGRPGRTSCWSWRGRRCRSRRGRRKTRRSGRGHRSSCGNYSGRMDRAKNTRGRKKNAAPKTENSIKNLYTTPYSKIFYEKILPFHYQKPLRSEVYTFAPFSQSH